MDEDNQATQGAQAPATIYYIEPNQFGPRMLRVQ